MWRQQPNTGSDGVPSASWMWDTSRLRSWTLSCCLWTECGHELWIKCQFWQSQWLHKCIILYMTPVLWLMCSQSVVRTPVHGLTCSQCVVRSQPIVSSECVVCLSTSHIVYLDFTVCFNRLLPTTVVVQVEQLVQCVCLSVCPGNNFYDLWPRYSTPSESSS